MILFADCCSPQTDWCIVFNGTPIKRMGTKGINPFFQSEEEIQQELTHSLLPQLPEGTINSVFFYGAGCTPEKAPVLRPPPERTIPHQPACHRKYQSQLGYACRCPRTMRT